MTRLWEELSIKDNAIEDLKSKWLECLNILDKDHRLKEL